LDKKISLLLLVMVFSLAAIGTVSAADGSTEGSSLTTVLNDSNNGSSATLPDPRLYDENGNLVGSYTTIQEAYSNAATGTSTQMYTIELEENGVFTLTDFTIAKNLIFTVANGGTATIQGSNNRLVYIAPGYTVYFYNITFQNGHASDGTTLHPDGYNGGAIYNEGTLYLTDCVLRNNQAGDGGAWDYGGIGGNGGAIYNTGTATITDSQINSNTAGNGGSGADGSDGLVSNGYTGHNGGTGGSGGAIYNTNHLEIYGTEISNNEAGNGGEGGNGGNSGELGTEPFTGGNGGQGGAGGNGGGVFNSNYLLLNESTVTSNRSGNGGTGGNGGQGSDRWRYWWIYHWIYVPSGNGGNGGTGGNSGSGAGIYHSGTYLEVTSNNLTDNHMGTPANGGTGGLKGSGDGGVNGNAGTIGNNGTGGAIYAATAVTSSVNYNRILNNTLPDIASYNGISVNAENNWWGTNFENSSPSAAGRVSSGVDANPWVILRLIVPNPIYNGIPVQIIGDLTLNSDGNPVGGYIPNGVEAIFTATRGTVNTPQNTLNGLAPTNYSPTSFGMATFTVTVDDQTVTVNQNVEPRAVLDFTKSVSDSTPNYGDLIHFIITVQNSGPDVTDVIIHDLLPKGLVYQSHTLNAGEYDPTTGLWIINGLSSSTGGIYLDILALVNATGFFNNTATLTQSAYPQDEINRSATLNVDPASMVSVDITDNTVNHQADVGDNVTYTITVHNAGPDNATNVVLTSVLPAGLDFVSASDGGIYDSLTRTITWAAFNLNYGAPDVIRTFVATVNAEMAGVPAGIVNTANATYTEYPSTANGTNTAIHVPLASLYINSWASKNNPVVGENITLTFKVGNNGPDTARNVVFTLPIPAGMEYVDVLFVDQGTVTYDPLTRTITWTLGDVVVGDPTLQIRVKVLSAGNFVFTPRLTTDTYDLSIHIQSITVNAQKDPVVVNGATNTIGMQNTGAPIAQLLLAVLMVLGGLFVSKRR